MNQSAKCAVAALALFLFMFLLYVMTGDIFYIKCCIMDGFYFALCILGACLEDYLRHRA